jgi:hypothetical protein
LTTPDDPNPAFVPETFLLDLLSHCAKRTRPSLSAGDWARVVALARAQRVLPCLEPALGPAGLKLPCALAPARETRRAWQMRALALQAEALRVHTLLHAAGIAHVFLKGIVLAALAYPDPSMRQMRDLDVLVRPEDLARARALLAEAGGEMQHFAHKPPLPTDDVAKHATPVWSPRQVVAVELHAHLTPPFQALDLTAFALFEQDIWARLGAVRIGGAALPCLAPEDMCLHLVMHGLYDHELNNGPVFVTDLLYLLRAVPLDGAEVERRAERLGIAEGLALSLSLLPSDVPAARGFRPARTALPRDLAAALMFQDGRFRTELRLSADLAERGALARLRLLLRKVFAPRHVMLDRWRKERDADSAPPALPWLWLWFVRTRHRQMQTVQGAASPFSATLRQHLLTLRALRASRR